MKLDLSKGLLTHYQQGEISDILEEGLSNHYFEFKLKKRSGKNKYRTINAPSERLKKIQREITEILSELSKSYIPNNITGFRAGYNIKDNALYHRSKDYEPPKGAVRIDIKDAFGSITSAMIREALLNHLFAGYPVKEDINKIISICTYNNCLPQGAPSSPVLLNISLVEFDKYAQSLIQAKVERRFDCRIKYSRFADDIVISSDKPFIAEKTIKIVSSIAKKYGISVNTKKTRIMGIKNGIFVTGINIVNSEDHISVSRKNRSKIRAAINEATLTIDHLIRNKQIKKIVGRIAHIISIDNIHGSKLLAYAVKRGVVNKHHIIAGLNVKDWLEKTTKELKERKEYYAK